MGRGASRFVEVHFLYWEGKAALCCYGLGTRVLMCLTRISLPEYLALQRPEFVNRHIVELLLGETIVSSDDAGDVAWRWL